MGNARCPGLPRGIGMTKPLPSLLKIGIAFVFGAGGLLFVIGGLGIFARDTLAPLGSWMEAGQWEAVPCAIQHSEVDRISDGEGARYEFDVRYTYLLNGHTYTGTRFGLLRGTSLVRKPVERLASMYPRGAERVCYVDPAEPALAVLSRDFQWQFLQGLAGMVYVAAGGLFWWLASQVYKTRPAAEACRGEVRLAYTRSRGFRPPYLYGPFLVLAPLAGFLVYAAIVVEPADDPHRTFLLLALGSGTAAVIVSGLTLYHQLVALNPRPVVYLQPGTPCPGDELAFRWCFEGRSERLQAITMTLDCIQLDRESGSNTPYWGGKVLMSLPILASEEPAEFLSGSATIGLPEASVPTHWSKEDRFFWQVRVQSRTKGLPGMLEYLGVTVMGVPAGV